MHVVNDNGTDTPTPTLYFKIFKTKLNILDEQNQLKIKPVRIEKGTKTAQF